MGSIHLITGGVKSGKSSYALRLASRPFGLWQLRVVGSETSRSIVE